MKNASLLFACCILLLIITPIIVHLYNKPIPEISNAGSDIIKVHDTVNNTVISMPFEEYVWRVVAKEMPASFEHEALKAQAVAARTYAIRKYGVKIEEHHGADMCTSFEHCTAMLLPGEEKELYGANCDVICEKYKNAAASTKGEILTYNNEPIIAAFHSISSGITEKSSDIWVSQLPYLVNVDSNLDKKVDGYHTQVSYNPSEIKKRLNLTQEGSINIISRTTGGSVKEIEIFGHKFSGDEVRKLLDLRSTNFTVSKRNNVFYFDVFGYGHGVGMSQHGANEHAKIGDDYKKILEKYYPGTKITKIYFKSVANMTK